MSMSRKDYEAVAEVLHRSMIKDPQGAVEDHVNAVVNNIAAGLAVVFAQDNPRFDPLRFFLAVKTKVISDDQGS